MNREQVQDLPAMIQATYPNYNPPSKTAAVNAWTMALDDYGADEVAMAFKAYIKTNTSGFAPAPGQLIEVLQSVKRPQEPNEMEAWALVSKAIRNSGYNSVAEYEKLPSAVKKAVGTPSQLRIWALDENYNEQVASSNFIKTYRNEIARQKDFQKLPSNVQRLVQNASKNAYTPQIGVETAYTSKSSQLTPERLETENTGIEMPKKLKERMERL